jgi:hypothetical protein
MAARAPVLCSPLDRPDRTSGDAGIIRRRRKPRDDRETRDYAASPQPEWRSARMTTAVVSYQLEDGTAVQFEVEPSHGFRPAGPDELVGRLREAVGPAVDGARAVLEKAKEAAPDEVQLRFGVKVSGTTNWLVAKCASEGNFEVTMTWTSKAADAT